MADSSKISKYRADVLEKSIYIEWLANLIISHHYAGQKAKQFILEVLHDEKCSYSLKLSLLEKTLKAKNLYDGKMFTALGRLSTIRNYFAHNHPVFSAQGKDYVPDPRKLNQDIKFDDLYSEFQDKEKTVGKYLINCYIEMQNSTSEYLK